jgi:bifunctional UDP-N-acetylglucosamine pyrophosphorylase / glucosamine-1-phosphate N-acetyltransferase
LSARPNRGRSLAAMVLAAGEAKRFKSKLPKVLHELCGKPLIAYALDSITPLHADRTVIVVGRGKDQVAQALTKLTKKRVQIAHQREQLGTADAARTGDDALGRFSGDVVVIPGDTPLLTAATLRKLIAHHRRTNAAATILAGVLHDPTGYGRIVRGPDGSVERVVEESDASPSEKIITEVNSSVWAFDRAALRAALTKIDRANAQREYYLTDVVAVLRDKGEIVEAFPAPDAAEILGVNSRAQLADVATLVRYRICDRLMADGVTIEDPAQTYIDATVKIGRDTHILPLTFLTGSTRVGEGCRVGPGVSAVNSRIDDGATVRFSTLDHARVGKDATVGPYAYLRPGARLAPGSKVGTFVEVKGSSIGRGSKVPHLSYIGDTWIGSGVNVGAGTITCNYDGMSKHRTVIGDGAFIGSDTMLVAPVKVGRGAYTGAGSSITRNVPPNALALERSEQRNVKGWAKRNTKAKPKRSSKRPGGSR